MYIIHSQLADDANRLDHKTFLCQFISALLGRAAAFKYGRTRTAITKANKGGGKYRKRQRMSTSAPALPKGRLLGKKEDHTVTIQKITYNNNANIALFWLLWIEKIKLRNRKRLKGLQGCVLHAMFTFARSTLKSIMKRIVIM